MGDRIGVAIRLCLDPKLIPPVNVINQAMKGRGAIRRCNESKLKTRKNEETELIPPSLCGLWSVPDDVLLLECLARVSRLDLVALATVSKRHRSFAVSRELRFMRYRRGICDRYLYVFMHVYPDPCPQWFVLHPLQRRLKRVSLDLCSVLPAAGSCFVTTESGVYIIGGLKNGKPTSEVVYFDCVNHGLYYQTPMKMARSGASASLTRDETKIYVFGGCSSAGAESDSSNWVEVYDIETKTWDLLSVFTPKMPLKIQRSVVMDEEHVYTVDEDGQIFIFLISKCLFLEAEALFQELEGITEPNLANRNDWILADGGIFICRGNGGKILWRTASQSDWKEVKGLEELQQQHPGFDIIKLCPYPPQSFAIFWESVSRPQAPHPHQMLELCYAKFTLSSREEGEVWVLRANVLWSGVVLSDSPFYRPLNMLYAGSVNI